MSTVEDFDAAIIRATTAALCMSKEDAFNACWEALEIARQLLLPNPDEGALSECTCGFTIVWTGDEWQHDVAPWRWGDDHDVELASSYRPGPHVETLNESGDRRS